MLDVKYSTHTEKRFRRSGAPFQLLSPTIPVIWSISHKIWSLGRNSFFFFLILLNLLTSEIVSVKQEPFVIQIFVMKGFRHNFFSWNNSVEA